MVLIKGEGQHNLKQARSAINASVPGFYTSKIYGSVTKTYNGVGQANLSTKLNISYDGNGSIDGELILKCESKKRSDAEFTVDIVTYPFEAQLN